MDASSAGVTFHAFPVQRSRWRRLRLRVARGRGRRLRERPDGADRRRPADPKEDSAGRSTSPHASASSGTQPTTRNGHGMPENPGGCSSGNSGAAAWRRGRVECVDALGAEAGHAVEFVDAFGASAEDGHGAPLSNLKIFVKNC